jgi:hypothetical protein
MQSDVSGSTIEFVDKQEIQDPLGPQRGDHHEAQTYKAINCDRAG